MKAVWLVLRKRIAGLFQRRRLDAEMAEEMRAHLEVLTERNLAAGMTPEEARLAARKRFGGVAQIEERCRDERGFVWLEQFAADVCFSWRALIRARNFSLAVIFTLFLGLAVATAVFNLAGTSLFFDPPFPRPGQLLVLGYRDKQTAFVGVRPGIYLQSVQEQTNAFSELAAAKRDRANVVVDGEPIAGDMISITRDSLRVFGITPGLGRGFAAEEHRAGADDVVIISNRFWRRHFGADPAVLGRKILVDQRPCTVIGVFRRDQAFPVYFDGDIYRPLVLTVDPQKVFDPMLVIIGRLRAGVTREQAEAALTGVKMPGIPQWAAAFFGEQRPAVRKLEEVLPRTALWLMTIAAAFLLAIAGLNAMNLMLVRLVGRGRELSIRLAVGGTRGRIARLVAIESAMIGLAAGAIVIVVAGLWFPPLIALVTGNEAARDATYLNGRTWVCVAILAAMASGGIMLVPTLRLLRANLSDGLKAGGPSLGETPRIRRLRNGLVILQSALAVILLAGTGLMMRTFQNLRHVDLGFDPVGKVKVWVAFPAGYELGNEARLQLFDRLESRLRRLPGVRDVASGQDSLLVGGFWGTAQLLMKDGSLRPVAGNFVSAGYQKAAGITLKRGRWFSDQRGAIEVVVNETMARERFAGDDPIGQTFKIQVSGDLVYSVVGVARDVKDTVRTADGMRYYLPAWLYPPNTSTLILRLDRDPDEGFAAVIRRAIYELDPRLITTDVTSIATVVDRTVATEHSAYLMLQGLSVIALGLAAIGLFSIIAYAVDCRMKEFGVRLALGARPENLHRLVMKRGLTTAAIGIALGVAGALALTRFMQSLLFETTPYDPLVYAAVALVLLAAAALACWLPARRAARVDITKLLRTE